MKIAVIGWGSLVWDQRELPIVGGWEKGGPILAVLGIVICVVLVRQVDLSQSRILAATVAAAFLNWLWIRFFRTPNLSPDGAR